MPKKYLFLSLVLCALVVGSFAGVYYWRATQEALMCGPGMGAKSDGIKINWVQPQAEKEIPTISDQSQCPAHKKECRIKLGPKQWISLELGPKPVLAMRNTEFKVKVSDDSLIPEEIEILGINLNMGYLRPTLRKISDQEYKLDFGIPFCEEQEMRWKAIVRYRQKNAPDNQQGALFYFTSLKD